MAEDQLFSYADNRSRFLLSNRIPKGFKEAIEAIDDAQKQLPVQVSAHPSTLFF